MFCAKCGKANDDQARFCQECGAVLQAPRPTTAEPSVQQQAAAPSTAVALRYAGFWKRLLAYIIDSLVLLIPGFILGVLLGPWGGFILGWVMDWVYFAVFESSTRQATLGKIALGIRVTNLDGQRISFGRATGRYWAKILSALILLIGFIMAGFTAKKQALHDMIAGTLVVVKQ